MARGAHNPHASQPNRWIIPWFFAERSFNRPNRQRSKCLYRTAIRRRGIRRRVKHSNTAPEEHLTPLYFVKSRRLRMGECLRCGTLRVCWSGGYDRVPNRIVLARFGPTHRMYSGSRSYARRWRTPERRRCRCQTASIIWTDAFKYSMKLHSVSDRRRRSCYCFVLDWKPEQSSVFRIRLWSGGKAVARPVVPPARTHGTRVERVETHSSMAARRGVVPLCGRAGRGA